MTTDHRVDLFALGVTAYEVFTGDMPWEKAQSLQTLLSHMNSPGKDPRELRPEPGRGDGPIPDQGDRARPARIAFQTAADFRDAVLALPKKW